VLDPNAPGFIGFAGRTRVAVLNDDDLPKAQEILRRLQPPQTGPPPSWRLQKRGLICVGLGVLLIPVTASTIDFEAVNPLDNVRLVTWILLAASGLLIVGGFTLIFLGPRADKEGKEP